MPISDPDIYSITTILVRVTYKHSFHSAELKFVKVTESLASSVNSNGKVETVCILLIMTLTESFLLLTCQLSSVINCRSTNSNAADAHTYCSQEDVC